MKLKTIVSDSPDITIEILELEQTFSRSLLIKIIHEDHSSFIIYRLSEPNKKSVFSSSISCLKSFRAFLVKSTNEIEGESEKLSIRDSFMTCGSCRLRT